MSNPDWGRTKGKAGKTQAVNMTEGPESQMGLVQMAQGQVGLLTYSALDQADRKVSLL